MSHNSIRQLIARRNAEIAALEQQIAELRDGILALEHAERCGVFEGLSLVIDEETGAAAGREERSSKPRKEPAPASKARPQIFAAREQQHQPAENTGNIAAAVLVAVMAQPMGTVFSTDDIRKSVEEAHPAAGSADRGTIPKALKRLVQRGILTVHTPGKGRNVSTYARMK